MKKKYSLNLSKQLTNKLHIVCFDVPFPPTYGGVMDVFYKIRSLSESGIQIYLHVFQYGRQEQIELTKYCEKVNYYPRKTTFVNNIGFLPYIVKSRSNEDLIKNIKAVEAPILFEGLHTTLALKGNIFEGRKTLVRTHNIEHLYYNYLAKTESNIFKKLFYKMEAAKLKYYERILKRCDHILSISRNETKYFKLKYGSGTEYLPAFHPNESIYPLTKKGYFALYHGNLAIDDNLNAALYLINCFKTLDYPLVIAGQSDNKKLHAQIDAFKNISFIPLKDEQHLLELFHRAHINVLFSFQQSGIKLKLINALFQGRYAVANSNMTEGTGLEELCHIANDKNEIRTTILKLIDLDFSDEEIAKRKQVLVDFSNKKNAQKIIDLLNA
jgi:hypothetical protein